MKIAVIGTGIAGNVVAHRLSREHDITVFESNDYVGGHSHTVDVTWNDRHYAVDTGFIVFNDWTYPNFIQLLDELHVTTQATSMSFSVRCERSGLEYSGSSLNTLFAQRRNLFRPDFYQMLKEILRFNRDARELLNETHCGETLGEYLYRNRYADSFIRYYIVPMGAAIWSTDPQRMLEFPAENFVRFFAHHGLLNLRRRPTWRVVDGGSRQYVDALVQPFRHRIRLNTPVVNLKRFPSHVLVTPRNEPPERYDYVFLACHSDQALDMLADATLSELEILSAIPYQTNEVVLHTDASVLPRERRAWAAWNYHVPHHESGSVAVSYNMNILQGLNAPVQLCITLNRTDLVDPGTILHRIRYQHPLFTRAGAAAQKRHAEINGARRTYYCGAYWRHGFHEDGVVSALSALEHFENRREYEERDLRRAG